MKKKQKAKLLKQFRPNYEETRSRLFQTIIKKAKADYGLTIQVYIDPMKQTDMTVAYQDQTGAAKQIAVPMDENFVTVVKRIQKQERGLMERFSENLTNGIAEYLAPMSVASPSPTHTEPKALSEASSTNQQEVSPQVSAEASSSTLSYKEFTQKISDFAKFFVEKVENAILVKEKTPKEDRLLATISATEENDFTIEKALERKYKLKTEVVPVIEAFAGTAVEAR